MGHQKFKIVNSYSLESHLLEKEDVGLVLALCGFRGKKWTTVFFPATQCATIVISAGLLETVQLNCGKKVTESSTAKKCVVA